jgi:uncharacterized membrane protein
MKNDNIGKFGAALSLGCAVHCLTFPVLMPFMPFLGKEIFLSHSLEMAILGLAAAIGLFSLVNGFIRHHGRFIAFPVFFLGLAVIITGFVLHHNGGIETSFVESVLLIIGGLLMGAAQFLNHSFPKRSVA